MMTTEYFIFEVGSFCVMNQKELLCRSYLEEISCFKMEIPYRFESSQTIGRYCSVSFPPGYSIYVEDFFLDKAGPDDFVLLDGKPIQYNSKLKWVDRRNKFWEKLNHGHPLKKESNLRSNHRCVNSLKVKNSGLSRKKDLLEKLGKFRVVSFKAVLARNL